MVTDDVGGQMFALYFVFTVDVDGQVYTLYNYFVFTINVDGQMYIFMCTANGCSQVYILYFVFAADVVVIYTLVVYTRLMLVVRCILFTLCLQLM